MYIATVPNRGSPPAILLRESYRADGKVKTRTLANLSKLPPAAIEAVRSTLAGKPLIAADEPSFEILASPAHGSVQAVMRAMHRLGIPALLDRRRSPERDRALGLLAARVLDPMSKLATSRAWHTTSLPELVGTPEVSEDQLYEAMDWLLERQPEIEKRLAQRHLTPGGSVLYDLTSSYMEGTTCPLSQLGHNRDGKKGKLQINYGVLTDSRGCPVSVSVFPGDTADSTTLLSVVQRAREEWNLQNFVVVGDRGMITGRQIEALRSVEGLDWITALRSGSIAKLVESGELQWSLFDERNLVELTHEEFPGERLIACRNPDLAQRRARKREALLEATRKELEKIQARVRRGRVHGAETIEARVRSILQGYAIGRHYRIRVQDTSFEVSLDEEALQQDLHVRAAGDPERAAQIQARGSRHQAAIAARLEALRQRIGRGRLHGKDAIGVCVGKVVNKYKVSKHFKLSIEDDAFEFEIDTERVQAEAVLDGIYVIRTSVPAERMESSEAVRNYKNLSQVERAFRSIKTMDLHVRPIHHRTEPRVRAHIFLCMLAYYVQWHMQEAWRPLLFSDEDQAAKATRDPVAPAKRSAAALDKVNTRQLADGSPVHSFATLLGSLATLTRNLCRLKGAGAEAPTFTIDTTPTPDQQRALDRIETIRP